MGKCFSKKGQGGRPDIIANEEKFFVENLTQTAIEIPWGVEVVWAILTFKNPQNSSWFNILQTRQ